MAPRAILSPNSSQTQATPLLPPPQAGVNVESQTWGICALLKEKFSGPFNRTNCSSAPVESRHCASCQRPSPPARPDPLPWPKSAHQTRYFSGSKGRAGPTPPTTASPFLPTASPLPHQLQLALLLPLPQLLPRPPGSPSPPAPSPPASLPLPCCNTHPSRCLSPRPTLAVAPRDFRASACTSPRQLGVGRRGAQGAIHADSQSG